MASRSTEQTRLTALQALPLPHDPKWLTDLQRSFGAFGWSIHPLVGEKLFIQSWGACRVLSDRHEAMQLLKAMQAYAIAHQALIGGGLVVGHRHAPGDANPNSDGSEASPC